MNRQYNSVAFIASSTEKAQIALKQLENAYPHVSPDEADVIIALGGDGLMLNTLRTYLHEPKPIYGMNRGSVGFLMNDYRVQDLMSRLANAHLTEVHPLLMEAVNIKGETLEAYAINEVSLLRQSHEAARLCLHIDGKVRMEELISDGVLVSTPAGSTAYNLSANGPIIPLSAPLLALTPITAFRPRRWRGALLPDQALITIEIIDPEKRPVSAVADNLEMRNVARVEARLDKSKTLLMLHDSGHGLDERILREQFG